jgi:hypothetical protein
MNRPPTPREHQVISRWRRDRRDKAISNAVGLSILIFLGGFLLEILTWQLHDNYTQAVPEMDFWPAVLITLTLRGFYFIVSFDMSKGSQ